MIIKIFDTKFSKYVARWYKTDTNHVPAQSVLQPIDSILKQFLNKKDPTLQEIISQNNNKNPKIIKIRFSRT